MKIRTFIAQAIIYLFVISSGIHIGAAVYEAFVITPLWSGALPESVTGWNPVAQFAVNPGLYWGKFTPLYTLLALLLVITAWFMPKAKRNLMLFAGIVGLIIFLFTFFFFVPILMKTIVAKGAGYSGAEITQMANAWVNWNWLRLAAGFATWLAAIRALGLPTDATGEFNNENF